MSTLKGNLGYKGERGYSAYEIAVQNGFVGTEQDWLATLGTSNHFTKNSVIYVTTKGNETTLDLPSDYTSNSFLDVYIEGEKLNANEYTIDTESKTITLTTPLEVAGTTVEIVTLTMATNSLPIVETISDSSTNNEASGAKAVYDHVKSQTEALKTELENNTNNLETDLNNKIDALETSLREGITDATEQVLLWEAEADENGELKYSVDGDVLKLTDSAFNYRFLLLRQAGTVMWLMCPVMKNYSGHIRGGNMYANSKTAVTFLVFRGGLNADGTELTQSMFTDISISHSNKVDANYNDRLGVIEVWGVR